MKKAILSILLTMNLYCCQYLSQLNSDKELTKTIETRIKENPKKIDLTEIENFDYDQILILEPYSNIGKIQNELKIDLSNISENPIHSLDDINLIVLLKKNKSVKISELKRANGDFEDYKVVINKENAIFEKKEKGIIALIK